MALTLEKTTKPMNGTNGAAHDPAVTDLPPPPYLGRSVRIVGPHVNVDMNQSPHPKNARGELGKPLFNWYRNTISRDPLTRVSAPNHFADQRNFLASVVNQAPKGKVNSRQIPVSDPAAMTRHGFLELTGNSCLGVSPFLGVAVWQPWSVLLDAALIVFALALFGTNLFHKWAHSEKVPRLVAWLQRWHLILNPARHRVHHTPPNRTAYCVTNGWMNALLDGILP